MYVRTRARPYGRTGSNTSGIHDADDGEMADSVLKGNLHHLHIEAVLARKNFDAGALLLDLFHRNLLNV